MPHLKYDEVVSMLNNVDLENFVDKLVHNDHALALKLSEALNWRLLEQEQFDERAVECYS